MSALLLQPRALIAAGLFLISLMVVIPASHLILWYLVLLVTEYGHFFALFMLALLGWELLARWPHPNPCTLLFGLAALVFYLMPLASALWMAQRLPTQLAASLGGQGAHGYLPSSPLSVIDLFGWVKTSAVEESSLHYVTKDGSSQAIQIYRQPRLLFRPCIVLVHGGGWNSGDERQLPEMSRQLARAGYTVASISYRLAPEHPWPAQKEDVRSALDYLKAHAGNLDLDPHHFIIMGRSAGGQIALAAAYALQDPSVCGVVASYAPTDMNFAYDTGKEHDILGSRHLVRGIMGGPPPQRPALYRDASPRDLVGHDTPSTLLVHGVRDELVWVRHSERLRDRLLEYHRPVFLLELPWATHGFDVNSQGPGGQLEYYAICWFLNSLTPLGH